ncbi:unnamed protein product [Acanthoscelides obtectus]|uniref:Uncharacterized protein n=1 Tax=Acanthoscelides obtectus TaxID=200917 RepID=A0A9P0LCJ9_ACAOB|nr:unnamed protein product [Acanthoscelides obtectus]CAK1655259.1 hypothetical protein AOBTE_LOCUS19113 [Acanthoscelides obtectus]
MGSNEQETSNDNESTIDAECNESDTEITNHNLTNPATPSTSTASSTRRKRQANEEIAKTIPLIGEKLEKPDDEYDAIGKNVAAKLRNMTATQQGIAEKVINEVIFFGRFEKLTFNTTKHRPGPVQVPQTPLVHIPAVPVQMQETEALHLSQDSQIISVPVTLIEYLNFNKD